MHMLYTHGYECKTCIKTIFSGLVNKLSLKLNFCFQACFFLQRLSLRDVRNEGTVSLTPDAKLLYDNGPWTSDTPAEHLGRTPVLAQPTPGDPPLGSAPSRPAARLASRTLRHLEALQATALVQAQEERWRQEALLSAGGPGAGSVWLQVPKHPADYFGHFRMATMRRLGLLTAPAGATCCIPSSAAGGEPELCGHVLDRHLQHPQLCKQGVARQRPHRALATTPAKLL